MKNLTFYDFIFIVSNEIDGALVRIGFIGFDNLEDFRCFQEIILHSLFTHKLWKSMR